MVLQEVADVLREYIFDQMPIRMLKVPEIKLIERREIYQHLLPSIEDITEDTLSEKAKEDWARYTERSNLLVDVIKERAQYAILSHTWLDNEVTYEDWNLKRNLSGPGYDKLVQFCTVAAADYGVSLAWMDTICIDKQSTSELDESIRSMYRWYAVSSICIIFLANTTSLVDMPRDRWFTRGWTLQELLAPSRFKFYDKAWTTLTTIDILNDRPSRNIWNAKPSPIHDIIAEVTGISFTEMQHFIPGSQSGDFSRRMTWAAKRTTTRGEDRAYSLMGIFSVTFPIAYGEGVERAFFRLIEQILHSHRNILDILNWAGRPIPNQIHSTNLLASSPECYLNRAANINLQGIRQTPAKPMILTHLGLQVRLIFVNADVVPSPSGDASSLLQENKVVMQCTGGLQSEPTIVHLKHIHDRDLFGPFRFTWKFVFGIWNMHESGRTIEIPETCAALLFRVPHVNDSHFQPLSPPTAPQSILEEEQSEDEDDLGNLTSCMIDTTQVITFKSSRQFQSLNREKKLKAFNAKIQSVYL